MSGVHTAGGLITLPCKTVQNRRTALLTVGLAKQFPPLYSTQHLADQDTPVIAKFFHPMTDWTFYAVEGGAVLADEVCEPLRDHADEPLVDVEFFGLYRSTTRFADANGGIELTYLSLRELLECRKGFVGFERDSGLKPGAVTLAQAKEVGP